MATKPDIAVRISDRTVEEERDRIRDEWWNDPVAAPKAKKAKKGPKATPAPDPEPSAEPEDARSPEEIAAEDAATATLLSGPLLLLGRTLTGRFGVRDYSPEEAQALAEALVPVLNKYFPAISNFGPEALLVLTLVGQAVPRLTEPRADGTELAQAA